MNSVIHLASPLSHKGIGIRAKEKVKKKNTEKITFIVRISLKSTQLASGTWRSLGLNEITFTVSTQCFKLGLCPVTDEKPSGLPYSGSARSARLYKQALQGAEICNPNQIIGGFIPPRDSSNHSSRPWL